MFSITRYQHPVGHGGFHSGILTDCRGKVHFSWIYDCGTVSKDNISGLPASYSEIDYFSRYISDRHSKSMIDLAIISHLDEDHWNSFGYLKKKIKVHRLIIPATSLIERISIFINSKNPLIDSDFVLNQIEFFQRISGAEEVLEFNQDERELTEELSGGISISWAKGNIKLKTLGLEIMNLFLIQRDYIKECHDIFWESLYKRIIDKYPDIGSKENLESIFNSGGKISQRILMEDLKQVKESQMEAIEEARKKDTSVKNKLNSTSLSLYSRPNRLQQPADCWHFPCSTGTIVGFNPYLGIPRFIHHWRIPLQLCCQSNLGGWLLTGDSELNTKRKSDEYFNEVLNITGSLSDLQYFSLPHHGAKTSWNNEIINQISNNIASSDMPLFIAECERGVRSNWRHPYPEVVNDILNANANIHICSKYKTTGISSLTLIDC